MHKNGTLQYAICNDRTYLVPYNGKLSREKVSIIFAEKTWQPKSKNTDEKQLGSCTWFLESWMPTLPGRASLSRQIWMCTWTYQPSATPIIYLQCGCMWLQLVDYKPLHIAWHMYNAFNLFVLQEVLMNIEVAKSVFGYKAVTETFGQRYIRGNCL